MLTSRQFLPELAKWPEWGITSRSIAVARMAASGGKRSVANSRRNGKHAPIRAVRVTTIGWHKSILNGRLRHAAGKGSSTFPPISGWRRTYMAKTLRALRGYLKSSVELKLPAPVTRLLGPTETAVPPFSKLMPVGLLLSTPD